MEDFIAGMINDICGTDVFQYIFETLSMNLFSGGEIMRAVETLHETIKPVALMLMFIYFMVAVVDKLSSENFTWEQLWRQMAMLLVSKFLIDHGFEILKTLFAVGLEISNDFNASYEGMTAEGIDTAEMVQAWIDSYDWLPEFLVKLLLPVVLFFPWLMAWAMTLFVGAICYSRTIEIYARAVFAPLAISDFFHSGLQSAGWRFLKNFLAVCLQGALILTIAIIYSKLFQDLNFEADNIFLFVGKYLAFYLSAVTLMFKSLPLTKEILGTGG